MFTRSKEASNKNTKKSTENRKENTTEDATNKKSQGKRPAKSSAAMENKTKKRKVEMHSSLTLVGLIDDVLLSIFRYLNWNDAINFAATCKRLRQLNSLWVDRRCKEFNLDSYADLENTVARKMFTEIAPHIGVLKAGINDISKAIMKDCKNLKSLRIKNHISRSKAAKVNVWIRKLKLESLRFDCCDGDGMAELLDGVTELRELESYCHEATLMKYIEKNPNLERLSIELHEFHDLRIFEKMQNLKCLHLRTSDLADLGKIHQFGKLDGLTEFSLTCHTFSDEPDTVLSFVEHLVKTSKLDKLEMVDCKIDQRIFSVLEKFNLRALSLCSDYSPQDFSEFISTNASPRLKHLKLSKCTVEQMCNIVANWASLETICIYVDNDEFHPKIADHTLMYTILAISSDRQPLRLHIRSERGSEHPDHIEVRRFVVWELKFAIVLYTEFFILLIADMHQL